MKLLSIVMLVLSFPAVAQTITVSGFIREKDGQESIPFANVIIYQSGVGNTANSYGFFSISCRAGEPVVLRFTCVGFTPEMRTIESDTNVILSVEMARSSLELGEVTVTASSYDIPSKSGVTRLSPAQVQNIPALAGEKDIIKAITLLPGVKVGTEGSTNLHVRGGNADQNLILLDDATVYNANHLFGFLSVFNTDAIKSIDFWKAGFPAKFGGRSSSVLNLQMKEGNMDEWQGEGGIGVLLSRLTLDGPLTKKRGSAMVSARRSYFDLLLFPFANRNSYTSYRIYDLNAKVNYRLGDKNRLYLSGYFGNDRLRSIEKNESPRRTVDSRNRLGWGNATTTLRWNHVYNSKLFSNMVLTYSHFDFLMSNILKRTGTSPSNTFIGYTSKLTDYSAKFDLDYYANTRHQFNAGFVFFAHQYLPSAYVVKKSNTEDFTSSSPWYFTREIALYGDDTYSVSSTLELNGGVRLAGLFAHDSAYRFVEPRFGITWKVINSVQVYGNYTRAHQFVHLLSNSGIGLATDLWVPVTSTAPPQLVDQLSAGITRKWSNNQYSITLETYRKYMKNIIAYKEGATFLDVSEEPVPVLWEDNITVGKGKAYGTELLMQKNTGRLTGWVGYTLSWTINEFAELNNGKPFFPKFDSRHNISIVSIYKFSPKLSISSNWVYASGNALTIPRGAYFGNFATGTESIGIVGVNRVVSQLITEQIDKVAYFGSRNSFRAEAYHRLDLALQLHKIKKNYQRYWEFSIYNVYSRRNALYYYLEAVNDFENKGQKLKLKKKSLFPIIPSVSYNFKF